MKNKILSITLMILYFLNCVSLAIIALEDINKKYIYDNYTVEYNIINSWENNQNIEITITNTSEEPIENQMFFMISS